MVPSLGKTRAVSMGQIASSNGERFEGAQTGGAGDQTSSAHRPTQKAPGKYEKDLQVGAKDSSITKRITHSDGKKTFQSKITRTGSKKCPVSNEEAKLDYGGADSDPLPLGKAEPEKKKLSPAKATLLGSRAGITCQGGDGPLLEKPDRKLGLDSPHELHEWGDGKNDEVPTQKRGT